MELQRTELRDQIFYNHVQTDRFKAGYISFNFILPLAKETAAYYALLPNVLRRGSADYPDQAQISRRLEELYGADIITRNIKRGDAQILSFSADMLDNAYLLPGDKTDVLGEVVRLLGNLLFDPLLTDNGFRADYVETECKNRMDAVHALINNKRRFAISRCTELMCEGESAGVSVEGRVEDYENIRAEYLLELYEKMIFDARIEIFYVGARTKEEVEPLLRTLVAPLKRGASAHLPQTTGIKRRAEEVRCFEESAPAVQGNLVVGFRSGTVMTDPDYVAYPLFNEVFGGSPTSKLFMNVRERLSLCYFCSSFGDTANGTLFVCAGIENQNKDKAVSEILNQLENMRQMKITEQELHCAKQALFHAYRALSDSASGIESWYLSRVLNRIYDSPEQVMQAMESVNAEDIAGIARKVTQDCVYFLRGSLADENKEEDDRDEE